MLSSKILKGTKRVRTGRSKRPILQPYEVRIDGSRRVHSRMFATLSHRLTLRGRRPAALISVAYRPTGNLVVEITP